MITLLGFLILIAPFLLLFLFEDKVKGFFYIITSFFIFHFFSYFVLQVLSIFSYKSVLLVNSALVLIVLLLLLKYRTKINFSKPSLCFIFVFVLIFIQLWSVHYRYSGTVQTFTGWQEVTNNSYVYPKFSDEWVAAALMNYSIESKKLPLVNPFNQNRPFENILFPFHTMFSGLFLILNINPIIHFSILPLFLGMLMCLIGYGLLRKLNLNDLPALITVFFIPLIAQSGNLPGIWFALPYIVGVLFLLLTLAAFIMKDKYLYTSSMILSLLFYPPMIVFILPAYIVFFWKQKLNILILFILLSLIPLIYPESLSYIFRQNLDNGMVSFSIMEVIPILIFLGIFYGFSFLYKKGVYFVLAPMIAGLAYWIFYNFYPNVIILEYPRIVMITSILFVLISGTGFYYVQDFLSKRIFLYPVLIIFVLITFFYPIGNPWKNFTLMPFDKNISAPIIPAPPISRYVHPDDLNLFKDLKGEVFLAPPWKSLILAILTNNVPVETKASYIAIKRVTYKDFMSETCAGKNFSIQKYKIKYVYSGKINCEGFTLINTSTEGLHLYLVN